MSQSNAPRLFEWRTEVVSILAEYLPAMLVDVVIDGALTISRTTLDPWSNPVNRQRFFLELTRRTSVFLDASKTQACNRRLNHLASGSDAGAHKSQEISVSTEKDVVRARTEAMRMTMESGGTGFAATRTATAVSELARNIVQHAGRGSIHLKVENMAIEIEARDRGPGIPDVQKVLSPTYQSKTGMGAGLKGVKRLSEAFEDRIRRGQGDNRSRQDAVVSRRTFEWASAFTNAEGERLCGDACVAIDGGSGLMLALIDAAGHGPAAHEVAQKSASFLRTRAGELALQDLLTEAHAFLRGGRGAAISVLSLEPAQGRARFAGVGNVAFRSLGPSGFRGLPSEGIIGRSVGRVRLHEGTVLPGDLLVLHTDGVKASFPLEPLRPLSAQQAADRIVGEYGRGTDDAGCIVVKVTDG